jgi:hypothetical protein
MTVGNKLKAAATLASLGLLLAVVSCAASYSQIPAIAPFRPLPIDVPEVWATNAIIPGQDASTNTGDQTTKPMGAKVSTLNGCLSGPDKDGTYVLRSRQHRDGVQVLGGDDLKADSGSKVKLTGQWEAAVSGQTDANTSTAMRRFQVTQVEVLAEGCELAQ